MYTKTYYNDIDVENLVNTIEATNKSLIIMRKREIESQALRNKIENLTITINLLKQFTLIFIIMYIIFYVL